jgi:1-acyl-sn-glycerol-3-phosphate acyltransferase
MVDMDEYPISLPVEGILSFLWKNGTGNDLLMQARITRPAASRFCILLVVNQWHFVSRLLGRNPLSAVSFLPLGVLNIIKETAFIMFSKILYEIGRVAITSYVRLMLKLDVRWHEQLPEGPVLFAANHPSTTDPIFIQVLLSKPLSVMITSKVFSIPVLGAYMRKMKQICVTPGHGEAVLEEARQTLETGRSVTIFPEGLISPSNGFHAPRSGVARLALKSGVPVVPLGIYLSEKNCKRIPTNLEGAPDIVTWYLHGPYAITIGKALHFSGDANDKSLVRRTAETIMEHIRLLALESRQRALKAA